jgi:hypothetical protein
MEAVIEAIMEVKVSIKPQILKIPLRHWIYVTYQRQGMVGKVFLFKFYRFNGIVQLKCV